MNYSIFLVAVLPSNAFCFFTGTGNLFHYSITGVIFLILLFQGSMAFSESITLSKYPSYADYQLFTSQCIPVPKAGKRPNKKL